MITIILKCYIPTTVCVCVYQTKKKNLQMCQQHFYLMDISVSRIFFFIFEHITLVNNNQSDE